MAQSFRLQPVSDLSLPLRIMEGLPVIWE